MKIIAKLIISWSLVAQAGSVSTRPKPVAIYYGYPSLVNGAHGNLDLAAHAFNAYRIVVVGDGLELVSHPDHRNLEELLRRLTNSQIFGYICIGSSQQLTTPEVERRIMAWKTTGVQGVFLDEAGNDFGVSHDRREQIIDMVHGHDLSVFVNAFQPHDVFAQGTHLGKGDYYLLESFVVRMGALDRSPLLNSRVQQALGYRRRYHVGLVGITTTTGSFSSTLYRTAYDAAQKAMLDGFGWGEPSFSSHSNTLAREWTSIRQAVLDR